METYKAYRVWYRFPEDDVEYAANIDATSEEVARKRVEASDKDLTVTRVDCLSEVK